MKYREKKIVARLQGCRRLRLRWCLALLPSLAAASCFVPAYAEAFEINGGVSVGGLEVGTEPKLAVSPFLGMAWLAESGFLLNVHNMFSLIAGDRVGVHDRTSFAFGYAGRTVEVSAGPSLSIYWMLACETIVCRRVAGLAPGGQVEVAWYFFNHLGVSLSTNVAWYAGSSSVLPGSPAVMLTAGPILRLESK